MTEFEQLFFDCFLLFGSGYKDVKAFCEFYLITDAELKLHIFLICKNVAGKVKKELEEQQKNKPTKG